jgi:hypothetical protein
MQLVYYFLELSLKKEYQFCHVLWHFSPPSHFTFAYALASKPRELVGSRAKSVSGIGSLSSFLSFNPRCFTLMTAVRVIHVGGEVYALLRVSVPLEHLGFVLANPTSPLHGSSSVSLQDDG